MSYFTLKQVHETITIKNKKRISLIVACKSTQLLIFYQDYSYDHRQVFGNKILHEGKLKFLVTELVAHHAQNDNICTSGNKNHQKQTGYICLIGRKDETVHFGILNVESKLYKPYQALFYQTKIQCEQPKYHIVDNTVCGYPLLIEISPNVQNGIMIKCFDFRRKQWLNDILYLGSKYLSSHFVVVPKGVLESQNQSSFCLLSNGQKSQSLHVSCISITESTKQQTQHNAHQQSLISQSQQGSMISIQQKQNQMHFLFTKQLKYHRKFTFVGAHISADGYLFLVGNSLMFENQEKRKAMSQATSMNVNFVRLGNSLEPEYRFASINNSKMAREITVRDYLGYFEGSLLFVLENPSKYAIHRLSPSRVLSKQVHYDEELYAIPSSKIVRLQTSLDSNAVVSYELVCEQFFEKIKDSPSVIKLNYLMKVSKQMYYREILEKICPDTKDNDEFAKTVLSFL